MGCHASLASGGRRPLRSYEGKQHSSGSSGSSEGEAEAEIDDAVYVKKDPSLALAEVPGDTGSDLYDDRSGEDKSQADGSTAAGPLSDRDDENFDVLDEYPVEADETSTWKQALVLLAQGSEVVPEHVRDLVRRGIPAPFRAQVWMLCGGAALRASARVPYDNLVLQGKELGGKVAADVATDVPRAGAPIQWQKALQNILLAFAVRNPSIGYCQSFSTIVRCLLEFCDEAEAFWILCHIVERLLPAGYYTSEMTQLRVDLRVLESLTARYLQEISHVFADNDVSLSGAAAPWFSCLFLRTLPKPCAFRVLDCLLLEGPEVLFRTALALLRMLQPDILAAAGDVCGLLRLLQCPSQYLTSDSAQLEEEFLQSADRPSLKELFQTTIASLRHEHTKKVCAEDDLQSVKNELAAGTALLFDAERSAKKLLQQASSQQDQRGAVVEMAKKVQVLIEEAERRVNAVRCRAAGFSRKGGGNTMTSSMSDDVLAALSEDASRLQAFLKRFDDQLPKSRSLLKQLQAASDRSGVSGWSWQMSDFFLDATCTKRIVKAEDMVTVSLSAI
eukprot:TRINITY_DN21810_c0_g1_i1.p1 TRINITY_DN21810_c0_g1~~TRINITY_DN21810_c0_g1_i1.p1  ORF type:complete len:560 (+),score=143.39 TRINITY_DN21810_c0_g1_i1:145-1824(+)